MGGMTSARITPAQEQYLSRIVYGEAKTFNGRARRTIVALDAAGLVEYDYDLRAHANGPYTEVFTVTATAAGVKLAQEIAARPPVVRGPSASAVSRILRDAAFDGFTATTAKNARRSVIVECADAVDAAEAAVVLKDAGYIVRPADTIVVVLARGGR